MTYRQFKKTCIDYFSSKSIVKRKCVKKALDFEKRYQGYYCNFTFEDSDYFIRYIYREMTDKKWVMTHRNSFSFGCIKYATIQEACDHLWEESK